MKYLNICAMLLIAISSSFMTACNTDGEDEPTITEQVGDNYDDEDNYEDEEDDEPTGRWRKCGSCHGTGICSTCGGRGFVGSNLDRPCPKCDSEDGVCERCHGKGEVFY